MNDIEKQDAPGKRSPLYLRFYLAGVVILAVGLISAALIYILAADNQVDEIGSGKQYDFAVERIGGKAAVWAVHFNQWFGGLWHGKQLAFTLAFISIGAALVCFLIARSLSFDLSFKRAKSRNH
ncbi:hypothetical protein LSG25_15780 [Paralcaligenes sp. KSB-10]|jgi:hypothetical protein|uniref:hypothetical protein n=1 Tax=Paralcaligenes sp. KSB-10 TaxID=2901142 RepID=UPI001E5B0334|nr:hypothetical protein [Paralcaligenes sp. KSB-10]UHL63493.1 hypothetical protein LSG25_15780 [Paralcaligenes sp. KSB-10]